MASFDQFAKDDGSSIDGVAPPPAKVLDWLHGNADTDSPQGIHHRIGTNPGDAASGEHRHRGRDSFPLFDATDVLTDISNSATGTQIATAVNAINALLRKVGAG